MLVGAGQGAATVQCCSQVDLFVVADGRPVAEWHAIDAQASDAAIRVDVETQVAERLVVADFVVVVAVALQLDGRQHFNPLGVFVWLAARQEAGFQGGRRREVAGEE
ncbi:hypothetical protein D3C84_973660 [compost metagenome]